MAASIEVKLNHTTQTWSADQTSCYFRRLQERTPYNIPAFKYISEFCLAGKQLCKSIDDILLHKLVSRYTSLKVEYLG